VGFPLGSSVFLADCYEEMLRSYLSLPLRHVIRLSNHHVISWFSDEASPLTGHLAELRLTVNFSHYAIILVFFP